MIHDGGLLFEPPCTRDDAR